MSRKYIFETKRLGFSIWENGDFDYAFSLWSDENVTRLIGGPFDEKYVKARLKLEDENYRRYKVQYFPVFLLGSGEFIGCAGLRPITRDDKTMFEAGIHLAPKAHGKGYGYEALKSVIEYASSLGISTVYAGHHPDNRASMGLLIKVGFVHIGEEYYPPTGLFHPFYILETESK